MRKMILSICLVCLCFYGHGEVKAKKRDVSEKSAGISLDGLKFRGIGPALTSGRVADIAVNPVNSKIYYVAVASGGVWKTENSGITFQPVFDKYGSFSIGCVVLDPSNPHVIWVGTGENNHQRSVAYGDGVYRSLDDGKSWENMGLKTSRHIGAIVIHPQNPNVVYVAAEGSLWGPGGDRGLYKTEDGGKNWQRILYVSEHTGVNCVVMDPRDPQVLLAAALQRRAHVYAKIGGGPETALYKSADAGKSWRKITSGLPQTHMGEIGLAISLVNPDIVYAMIEAAEDKGGCFRSTDRGESWTLQNSYCPQGQYYNRIFCDPRDADKVYIIDVQSKVSSDGGKTFKVIGNKNRHVDDHIIWIDPRDTAHLMIGGDGGIYESYDQGRNWLFKTNLSVTQFYRVTVDNSLPFYYVYGGTQDNNSLGGPSRSQTPGGVSSFEWFVTQSGDGFWSQIDPTDPDIVYAELQYGGMTRFNRKTQERIPITPQPRKDELTYRWNWDAPLLISHHVNTRLYCAANKVFRSDDRGESWSVISDDLTRQIDRNSLKVMDKYWSVDAVQRNVSLSQYGTIVSLAESPVLEGLIYAGTDDGLIQITENGGTSWRKAEFFPGVPANTWVSDIFPSQFDENVVYAAFNNHKENDFKPYVLRSADKGKSWISICGNLPANGPVHVISQDFVKNDLLFAGTEFGIFFSPNDGKEWIQLKSGIPTISVRDIAIQKRENDLVLATFGRGIYILDDYSALRQYEPGLSGQEAHLFPTRDARLFANGRGLYGQGAAYFLAPNPPYGATFTYYLRDEWPGEKNKRRNQEKQLFENGQKITVPNPDQVRRDELQPDPFLLFTIYDGKNQVIRELTAKPAKGINRLTWDMAYASPNPVTQLPLDKKDEDDDFFARPSGGFSVVPGDYSVSISRWEQGKTTLLVPPQSFKAVPLFPLTLTVDELAQTNEFNLRVAEMIRILRGTQQRVLELMQQCRLVQQALRETPKGQQDILAAVLEIQSELDLLLVRLEGHKAKASYEENPPAPAPLTRRLQNIVSGIYASRSGPVSAQVQSLEIVSAELKPIMEKVKVLEDVKIKDLQRKLDMYKAPWTSGRSF